MNLPPPPYVGAITPKHIKLVRTWLGWTQQQAADFLCVTRQTYNAWETGKTEISLGAEKLWKVRACEFASSIHKLKELQPMSPEELKAIRLSSNLTQKAFAGALGVSQSLYNRWETGTRTPNAENLRTIQLFKQED